MKNQKRLRDCGIKIGGLGTGKLNSITDVPGITVGHCTVDDGAVKTGVTAVMPSQDNIFKSKMMAAGHVINGFGKTTGLLQVEELGTIETPIILTNTLSTGIASDALIQYMLGQNDDIGLTTGTVNPLVCECNDGYLNAIRECHIKKEHVFEAIKNASIDFEEGAFGAGRGMCCFGLKGGIGTASRIIKLDGSLYTMGALVLSNFGGLNDLTIDGYKAGAKITEILNQEGTRRDENGSIIVILAADIPMTERQLKRAAKRASVGISRTGGFIGNGSGEIVLSFSTANRIRHYKETDIVSMDIVSEECMNDIFRAVAESVEESILNSLICAGTTVGRDGHTAYSLSEFMDRLLF